MKKGFFIKRILVCESAGFGIVIVFLWLNELFDIPHIVFGSISTPVNITESIFETVIILILLLFTQITTRRLMGRIKYLEGFLRVCSFCKKINVDENWIPIETFIREHSSAEFTHSFCPECALKHYGEYLKDQS